MKRKDLEAAANVSNYTVGKQNQGKNVNVDVLVRICVALGCTVDDIIAIISDGQD